MNPIYLTEKHLESLMTGEIVAIEGPLNFSTKIVPPDTVRDTCHVSYSLHRAIVRRLEEKCATMQTSAHEGWQRADAADERIAELEAELTRLRLNIGHNA